MTNYVFSEKTGNIVFMSPKSGVLRTPRNCCTVHYSFDDAVLMSSLKVNIDSQWFSPTDIDDLIDFLTCAKNYLTNKGMY